MFARIIQIDSIIEPRCTKIRSLINAPIDSKLRTASPNIDRRRRQVAFSFRFAPSTARFYFDSQANLGPRCSSIALAQCLQRIVRHTAAKNKSQRFARVCVIGIRLKVHVRFSDRRVRTRYWHQVIGLTILKAPEARRTGHSLPID